MNTKAIKIGFVLTTYKRPLLVKRALISIIEEKCKGVEILIIDDQPNTNETYKNIKELINKNTNYIQNIKNLGLPKTRNIGIEILIKKVDYIIFLDDDDFIIRGSLKKVIKYIEENPNINWYLCPVKFREEKQTVINKYLQSNNYVPDYALGLNIKGDAAHVIKTSIIGLTRFHTNKGNHNEFTFFHDLSKKTTIFPIPVLLIKYNYQLNGLTYKKYYDCSIGQIWTRFIRIYYDILWLKNILENVRGNNPAKIIYFYTVRLIKDGILLIYHLIIYFLAKIWGKNFVEKFVTKIIKFIKKGKQTAYFL